MTPLIIVRLKSEQTRLDLLKASSRRPKDSARESGIYINLDLTPTQRAAQKALRDLLRKRLQRGEKVAIRSGRIVPLRA